MKKLLITLAALFVACTAFAECALYVEDFEVKQNELGTEIVVPVKAHFSARLNVWQVDLTLPQGLQAIDATVGADQKVTYHNSQGKESNKLPHFYGLGNNNRIIAIFTDYGYWQDPNGEDSDAWTPYGLIKWDGGDYEEMVLLHLRPTVNFKGGDIIFNTLASSTIDSRGGTILENGDENVHFTRSCHVSVEGVPSTSEPIEVAAPVITPIVDKDYVFFRIDWPASTGTHVYTGQHAYPRGEEDAEYEVEAYVTAHGRFAESAHATETIRVPAKEKEPTPTPPSDISQIVIIDAHGIEHTYNMNLAPEAPEEPCTYFMMITLHPKTWGDNVPFYFMIDGKKYGAETDMQLPNFTLFEENVPNPVIEGENMWYIPGDYTYSFALQFINDEITMFIAQGVIVGEEDEVQTEEPIFYGFTIDDYSLNDFFLEITPKEPSTIYYRVQYPDETWSNWAQYEEVLHFTEDGIYCVEAFALANGKLPSNEIQYWFVISPTISVNEVNGDKTVASVRYFNMAGQEMTEPDGMTIVVTTYTDGTTSAVKVMK